MAGSQSEFEDRLKRIEQTRRKAKRRHSTTIDMDGLVVTKPRRVRRRFPWQGVTLLILGFVVFKSMSMAHLGFGSYQDRIELLRNGGVVERAGAMIMAVDPLTEFLAVKIRPYIR